MNSLNNNLHYLQLNNTTQLIMPKVISSFLHLFNPPPAELSPTGQNQMINNLLLLPNGAEYVGDIVNNKPCGHGKLVYSNSQKYQGEFLDGMKHGKGKYYYIKGELYIGDWYQNKKHGKGQYFYENGTIYTGGFKDNKKHGSGKIEEQNGSYFEGQFKMNNKDAIGIYYDASKHKKYEILYDNGKVITQKEISLREESSRVTGSNDNDQDEEEDSKERKGKKESKKFNKEQQRQILSEDNALNNITSLNPCADGQNYSSQWELAIKSSRKQEKFSTSTLIAENYLDSKLLRRRINEWASEEVSSWLNQIGFGDLIEEFKTNSIEGDSLLTLDNDDLKQLNVTALGDRRILRREIQFLQLIFKSQCVGDSISKLPNSQITIDLVRELQAKKDLRDIQNKKMLQAVLSSSSSSSSQQRQKQEQKKREKENRKKKNKLKRVTMQSKVQQFLENKGIKLTFLIPKQQITIIKPIGKGGYGQVFLGRWLGQDVAVKKYLKKQGFRNKHIGNFIEEVEVINKLNHPCIVLYMGMCIYDNQYGMVTEFLSGGSLFDYLHKKKEKLNEEQIFEICKDVALGMAYLHGKNVLHCDLKSSNVLIDENWNVKLCDFGLSRINSTKNKRKNKAIRVGTPHWMAPEILKGEKYQCESDVYSYGILLWEMLTGNIPYKDLSTAQIIGLVGNDQEHHISIPVFPSAVLMDIFMKCTERKAKKRPSFKIIVDILEKHQNLEKLQNQKLQ